MGTRLKADPKILDSDLFALKQIIDVSLNVNLGVLADYFPMALLAAIAHPWHVLRNIDLYVDQMESRTQIFVR